MTDDYTPGEDNVRLLVAVKDPNAADGETIQACGEIAPEEFGIVVDDDEAFMRTSFKHLARSVVEKWEQERTDSADAEQ